MSYNSLFGLGSHSPDASLEGWWKLQDNAASTTVVDELGVINATLNGGSNTSAKSTTGPNSWLSLGLSMSGTGDFIEASVSGTPTAATAVGFVKMTADTRTPWFSWSTASSNDGYRLQSRADAAGSQNATLTSGTTGARASGLGATVGGWSFCGCTITGTTVEFIVDGSKVSNTIPTALSGASLTRFLVGSYSFTTAERGRAAFAGVALFSRALTSDELTESYAGPEPLNTVAPTLTFGGSTWTGTIGTWDSQSNGTIAYAWELRLDSDDSVVQSGTGSSPSGSNPADGSYYLWVRGTNDGGFDSAEDSVSTTQVLGGGGGFKPYFANRRSQLIGWAA